MTQGLIFNCRDRRVGRNRRHQFQQSAFFALLVLVSMPFLTSATLLPIQFAPPININLGSTADRFCAADFNGDGFPDLAVNGMVLTNDGTGTMRLWANFNGYGALGAGDFNGDHKMDLVTAGQVWLNNGNGTFRATNFSSPYIIGSAVAVADFNGDQKLDLAASASGVSIFLGQGNGSLVFLTNYGVEGTAMAMADFDGNTRIDLVTIGQYSHTTVLSGNGDGTFAPPANYSDTTSYHYCVATGDLNKDEKADIVTGSYAHSISVRLNNGDGTFGPPKIVQVASSVSALAVADFDGDGNPDIVAGNPLVILPGNGDGTFAPAVTNLSNLSGPEGANQNLVVADFDGDGRPDIATTSVTNNCVSILLNRTAPSVSIQNTSGLLVLNWTDLPQFHLEFTTSLGLPNSWSAVTNPSFVVNGQRIVVTTATSGNGYFRLRKP